MFQKKFIVMLSNGNLPKSAGSKALNLKRLTKHGIHVPATYVCTWEAYQRYLKNDVSLVAALQAELKHILNPEKIYAVRSSANIEDGAERSFAGQFKSALNVPGRVDDVLQAIWSVWSSAQAPAVKAYLERNNLSARDLAMAVIIQEMVAPVYSGVALSKNPVTGGDEVVVEAVSGLGSQLVQAGRTPNRWVNKWDNWLEKPRESGLPDSVVDEIIAKTRQIALKLRHPVDLEWVWSGERLYWVQAREITSLNHRNVYSNYIPREMLPGMIKPLIFSVNIPLLNSIWIEMLESITGKLGIAPEDLAKSFYYRVYFNMGKLGDIFESLGFPRESVEMMMGSLPKDAARPRFKPGPKTFTRLPWLLVFMADKWMLGPKMRRALPRLAETVRATPYRDLDEWSEPDLLAAIDRHYRLMHEVAYYNVMGPLMMGMYNRVLMGQLKKLGVEFANFDLTENMPEIQEYEPGMHLRRLHAQFRTLPPAVQEQIRLATFSDFQQMTDLGDFPARVAALVERFGHLSDNGNDFSSIPWRERPEMVLKLVTEFEPGGEEQGQKTRYADLKTGPLFSLFYRRSREFRLLREQVSGLYTHGYGLFRYYFLALGGHFTRRGVLDASEDIYYLTFSQVRALVNGQKQASMRSEVARHKADIERFRDILLPTIIYGDEVPPVREADMGVLSGIPTSLGHYTGKTRVVRGIQDFPKVQKGDVLVVPYSDVGWTPLFARAGAVVAESGGLLSHSSIVAREYNIPAVVSVEGATRLPDETLVTVNGHKGEVLIHAT